MNWISKFILLLIALTAIDYTAARWIARVPSPRVRKPALIASLAANLGILGFFKGSSEEIVGGFRLRQFAKSVIERESRQRNVRKP
jgi:hypothetical protein